MSEQLRAVVEQLYEGLNTADVELLPKLFDPAAEIRTPTSLPWSTGHYSGPDGPAQYFQGAVEMLESTRFNVEAIRVDGDWAAAFGDWTGKFRESGGEFNVRFVHFWTFRDGKVVYSEGISDTVGIVRAYEASGARA
ncbi:Ketosteroid isomerase-related protein [Actinomadura meyerae]|jgi:ketosteroid isomerase-like protein|uniref:Ketosteroid isomerase-related protein n=1 Tax=Actinomadura meyerae TaxID=240840 RepID=A0A239NAX2_9ACTN|nr:nuclear transport factor 2 family protein [Actinomadura meyerae]SNT52066.1 Ketosteroid isomerase-related protein [Actinomadura meyerae]